MKEWELGIGHWAFSIGKIQFIKNDLIEHEL